MMQAALKKQWPALNAGRLPSYGQKYASGGLLAGLDAARAHVHTLLDAVFDQANPLHIRLPGALGMAHGVADVVSKLRPLAAHITLGHWYTPCSMLKSRKQMMTEPATARPQ
jgi:hypothetical protein